MQENKSRRFDLEERTQKFARDVRLFARNMPKKFENIEDVKQVLRSSGSVAANYIEANEALSKKDFRNRVKICRKEAKESRFWLTVLFIEDDRMKLECERLQRESYEFELIFGSILQKTA